MAAVGSTMFIVRYWSISIPFPQSRVLALRCRSDSASSSLNQFPFALCLMKINSSEHVFYQVGHHSKSKLDLVRSLLSTEEVVKSAFDAADESKDGALSASELGHLCLALGSSLEPQEVEAALQTLDTDGNGKIEYDEFICWWKGEGAKGFLY